MRTIPHVGRFTVITGHYGSGKTNLAVNLALDVAADGSPVTLVDLDVVNPYFRSSDYTRMLEDHGVHVIAPVFAGSTLDVPALSPAVASAFSATGTVIFDVGGDDVGATAMGRYSREMAATGYEMLYVVNRYRALTTTAEEAAALLREIEAASHLTATAVVNNSHLRAETTLEVVVDSMDYARGAAELLGLPLAFTTVPKSLVPSLEAQSGGAPLVENAYPVEVYVRTPWESGPGEEEVV